MKMGTTHTINIIPSITSLPFLIHLLFHNIPSTPFHTFQRLTLNYPKSASSKHHAQEAVVLGSNYYYPIPLHRMHVMVQHYKSIHVN